jgi:hypothetical protein
MIPIIQFGTDGFGHQLHGLFTCLVLHGVKDYYFDGYVYIKHPFSFEHIKGEESNDAKQYLIECVKQFIQEYKLVPIRYNNYIFSHEIYNIKPHRNTVFGLDNVFFFDKIPFYKEVRPKLEHNLTHMKKFFINERLPPNKLANNNIVFHIRLGDAILGRGHIISKYNDQLLLLIDKLMIHYPNHTYYIHSDGNIDFIEKKLRAVPYFIYNKNTKIVDVLSDLIYSTILICGVSSLSTVSSFLGDKKLIITNDINTHSMPTKNVYKITDYLMI